MIMMLHREVVSLMYSEGEPINIQLIYGTVLIVNAVYTSYF